MRNLGLANEAKSMMRTAHRTGRIVPGALLVFGDGGKGLDLHLRFVISPVGRAVSFDARRWLG